MLRLMRLAKRFGLAAVFVAASLLAIPLFALFFVEPCRLVADYFKHRD